MDECAIRRRNEQFQNYHFLPIGDSKAKQTLKLVFAKGSVGAVRRSVVLLYHAMTDDGWATTLASRSKYYLSSTPIQVGFYRDRRFYG